jgi:hypothetical protein
MLSTRHSCHVLMKLELSRQNFEKSLNIKFHEKPSSGSRVAPYGQTDNEGIRISQFCERT